MLKWFAFVSVPIALALTVPACSNTPVDAAGDYTLLLTNADNGCEFGNWTVGQTSSPTALTITQDGSSATATVGAGAGVALDLVLGGHVFVGTVDGNHLDLEIIGTRSTTTGGCTFTLTANVNATVTGDNIAGTLDYTTATNHSPDCGTKEACHSVQNFSGARPPAP